MRALFRLMTVLVAVPLMILNTLSGVVSGIWLAVSDEWGT